MKRGKEEKSLFAHCKRKRRVDPQLSSSCSWYRDRIIRRCVRPRIWTVIVGISRAKENGVSGKIVGYK